MREIFGQASKNIDGYRASIASKDVEIERLKGELEESSVSEQSYKSKYEAQQLTIETLNTEITSQKTFYGTEIKRLEAKTRQLSNQLEQTKNNYDQYKKRAHVLLEKNKEKSDSGRVNELEELVQQLQSQKTKYELEQAEKSEHQLLLEHDIRKAIDRIHELETTQNNMAKERDNKDKTIRELSQTFATDKESLEKKLQSTTLAHNQVMQQLNELKSQYNNQADIISTTKEETDDDMTQRYIDMKMRVHELEESNDSLYQQLLLKDNEIEKLIVSTPTSPPAEDLNNIPIVKDDEMDNKRYIGNDVYASMSSLLSPLVSRQIPDERIGLEKQVQRLSEMLHESQDKVNALKSQEKILKDELRKIDAFEKRQDVNVEYLKNVLVKFLMSGNKQAMVPILAKLLCLDTAETNTLMEKCI
ncbi:uncharacterized protein EV154DRAFT_163793 [Mucor mucedo]|uniref:uncharacterized protein n=1 Tax=Mucor mucedo TaxID=29922 RepID=UPI00221E5031|nr:uncharacterized protein EV154DRAFT_163793 [Mucor mucedo]KAI7893005.1 hypothetical protein EV154DRAFT_163793 [Mucor mucedo]